MKTLYYIDCTDDLYKQDDEYFYQYSFMKHTWYPIYGNEDTHKINQYKKIFLLDVISEADAFVRMI